MKIPKKKKGGENNAYDHAALACQRAAMFHLKKSDYHNDLFKNNGCCCHVLISPAGIRPVIGAKAIAYRNDVMSQIAPIPANTWQHCCLRTGNQPNRTNIASGNLFTFKNGHRIFAYDTEHPVSRRGDLVVYG